MNATFFKSLFLRSPKTANLLLFIVELCGICRVFDAPAWDGVIVKFIDGSSLEVDFTLGNPPIVRAFN